MKKKVLIICAVVIVIVAASAAAVAISANTGFTLPLVKRETVPANETVYSANPAVDIGKLTYLETETFTEDVVYDVYTDADGDKYRFDKSGKLVGYEYTGETPGRFKNPDDRISEAEALALGKEHAKRLFGDAIEEYTGEDIRYYEADAEYELTLTVRLGENGFITGPACYIKMLPKDGKLLSALIPRAFILDGFDGGLLNGVTRQAVSENALEQAAEKYPDGGGFEFKSAALTKENGKYCLECAVEFEIDGVKTLDKIYYPLQ